MVFSFRWGLIQELKDFVLVWAPGLVVYHLINYLKNLVVYNNKTCLWPHGCCGLGIQEQCPGQSWLRISHGVALKMSVCSVVVWTWRSHGGQIGTVCWWQGGLPSSSHGPPPFLFISSRSLTLTHSSRWKSSSTFWGEACPSSSSLSLLQL